MKSLQLQAVNYAMKKAREGQTPEAGADGSTNRSSANSKFE
jgi:hypothetical protein